MSAEAGSSRNGPVAIYFLIVSLTLKSFTSRDKRLLEPKPSSRSKRQHFKSKETFRQSLSNSFPPSHTRCRKEQGMRARAEGRLYYIVSGDESFEHNHRPFQLLTLIDITSSKAILADMDFGRGKDLHWRKDLSVVYKSGKLEQAASDILALLYYL